MEAAPQPHRCPKCNALVVDRRSPVCTTCRAALPADWVMTPEQTAKMMKLEAQNRAAHLEEMRALDPPLCNPDLPPVVRLLRMNEP
ncbi:MAG TPA: hypothetical protein VGC39_08465 [Candidatus Methylacidiphilales bacterium]